MYKFDKLAKQIATPSIILLCAAPKSGKTHLITSLLFSLRNKFNHGWAFSSTMFTGSMDFIPEGYRSDVFTEAKLAKILEYQMAHRKPAFLILDDLIGSFNVKSELMTKLLTTFRHYNLTIFLSTQYLYKIPPVSRTCATYAVVFKQHDERSIKALYESFFGSLGKYEAAKSFLSANTATKHSFIVVENGADPANKYKVSIAPPLRKFEFDY